MAVKKPVWLKEKREEEIRDIEDVYAYKI